MDPPVHRNIYRNGYDRDGADNGHKLGSLADFMSEFESYTFQIASASQMPIFGKSKGLVETARAAADQLSGGPADIKRQLAAGDLPANLRENRHLAVM